MPLCFVACKSGKSSGDNTSGGGNPGGESGGGGNSGNEPPAETYVLDDAEINRVLGSSYDVCKEFTINLNNSNLLKNNDYSDVLGEKTEPIFEYIFYPSRFVKEGTNSYLQENTYAYQPMQQQSTYKYFKVKANDSNDKINVVILVNTTDDLSAYFYEYSVNEGSLESLKLSYFYANINGNYFDFAEANLDFNNSIFELGQGHLINVSSPRTFLANKFDTKEHFLDINKWTYSYYQKFNFRDVGSITRNTETMPNNEHLLAQFDSFGFVGVYEIFDEFDAFTNSELTALDKDYFAYCFTDGIISFDRTNCTFDINEED